MFRRTTEPRQSKLLQSSSWKAAAVARQGCVFVCVCVYNCCLFTVFASRCQRVTLWPISSLSSFRMLRETSTIWPGLLRHHPCIIARTIKCCGSALGAGVTIHNQKNKTMKKRLLREIASSRKVQVSAVWFKPIFISLVSLVRRQNRQTAAGQTPQICFGHGSLHSHGRRTPYCSAGSHSLITRTQGLCNTELKPSTILYRISST